MGGGGGRSPTLVPPAGAHGGGRGGGGGSTVNSAVSYDIKNRQEVVHYVKPLGLPRLS